MEESASGVSLEEALTRTKFGKFNILLITLCGTLFTCWFYEAMGVGYYLPVAECDLNITAKQDYGVINGMTFAGIVVSYHFWGFMGDTKGRRKILIPTLFIAFGITLLTSLSVSFWMLAVLKFFNGLFVSASSCIVFAYMGEFHNTKSRSRSLMMASTMYGVAGILLPIFAWLIINQEWQFQVPLLDITFKPWRLFIIFCGLPSLISAVCLIWFPETPKFVYSTGNEEEALKILQKVYSLNTGKKDYNVSKISDCDFGTVKHQHPKDYIVSLWRQTCTLFNKTYLRSTIILCILQFGACSIGIGMLLFFPRVVNMIASFMEANPDPDGHLMTICDLNDQVNLLNSNLTNEFEDYSEACISKLNIAAYLYSILLEVGYTVGFFVIGILVTYTGVVPLSVFIFLCNGIAAIALLFVKNLTVSIYLYVIMLLNGLNSNMVSTAAIELYPTSLRSSAVSNSLIWGRIGSLIGGNVVGFLFDYHCDSTFVVNAVTFLSCCVFALFLPKPQK